MELDNELKQQVIDLIQQGKTSASFLESFAISAETKQREYELVYEIKEREEDILADTMRFLFNP